MKCTSAFSLKYLLIRFLLGERKSTVGICANYWCFLKEQIFAWFLTELVVLRKWVGNRKLLWGVLKKIFTFWFDDNVLLIWDNFAVGYEADDGLSIALGFWQRFYYIHFTRCLIFILNVFSLKYLLIRFLLGERESTVGKKAFYCCFWKEQRFACFGTEKVMIWGGVVVSKTLSTYIVERSLGGMQRRRPWELGTDFLQ